MRDKKKGWLKPALFNQNQDYIISLSAKQQRQLHELHHCSDIHLL
jgi:hypothetical protein